MNQFQQTKQQGVKKKTGNNKKIQKKNEHQKKSIASPGEGLPMM